MSLSNSHAALSQEKNSTCEKNLTFQLFKPKFIILRHMGIPGIMAVAEDSLVFLRFTSETLFFFQKLGPP